MCLVGSNDESVPSSSRCEPGSKKVVFPEVQKLLLENATVFLHAYLSTVNAPVRVASLHTKLNRYMPPPQPERYKNLLESSSAERAEVERVRKEHEKRPWVSYWKVREKRKRKKENAK
jgi:hypothetical protein